MGNGERNQKVKTSPTFLWKKSYENGEVSWLLESWFILSSQFTSARLVFIILLILVKVIKTMA